MGYEKLFYATDDTIIQYGDILTSWETNQERYWIVRNQNGGIEAVSEENVIWSGINNESHHRRK